MTSTTTKPDSLQPAADMAGDLFDNWFDPLEAEVRARSREFIEELLRYAKGDFARLPQLAMELNALKPRVIVAAAVCDRRGSQSSTGPAARLYRHCCRPRRARPGRKLYATGRHGDRKCHERDWRRGDH